jgi:hypothetical protein
LETEVNKLFNLLGIKQHRTYNPNTNEEHENNEYRNMTEEELNDFQKEFDKGIAGSLFRDEKKTPRLGEGQTSINKGRKALSGRRK